MISLRKITLENRRELFNLKTMEEQRHFVASNLSSVASCYVLISNGGCPLPFAIYSEEQMVGFVMIDEQYQRRGYGREAMQKILDYIRTFPAGPAELCWISYEPDNVVAKRLYESFGFHENGEIANNEPIAILNP